MRRLQQSTGTTDAAEVGARGGLAVVVVGVLFALAVLAELPFINGPDYWKWDWRTLPFARAFAFFAPPLVLYGNLLWRWSRAGVPPAATSALGASAARQIVAGLVLCCGLFQFASVYVDERTWTVIERIVKSRAITSYYTDAARIRDLSDWLPKFATVRLEHHSATHPPGPILFYYACIQLVGKSWAPLLGATLIGALATLGVATIYLFAGLWTQDRASRLAPCFLYALMPGLIVFVPEFDQIYPIGAMLILWFWARSFERRGFAVALGLTLFVCSLMAYNFLTIGAPMLLYALVIVRLRGWSRALLLRIAVAGVVALGVALGAHVLLWLSTSFHPIDSLLDALATQAGFTPDKPRPYWSCVRWDLYDFLLASGWMTLPLVVLHLLERRGEPLELAHLRALSLAGVVGILIIDFTGLLRCETARVWLFLQPLMLVPAGLQLARFRGAERAFVLALQALIVIALRCKMTFLDI